MSAPLLVLPLREEAPAANMATDLCMLRAFPRPECPRFRHYAWNRPCHTFGYGQDFKWVAEQTGESLDALCRRPTGGGVVDHRDDWTYALVIPATHPAAGHQIRSSYEALHRALAEAMALLVVARLRSKGSPRRFAMGEDDRRFSGTNRCFSRNHRGGKRLAGWLGESPATIPRRDRVAIVATAVKPSQDERFRVATLSTCRVCGKRSNG